MEAQKTSNSQSNLEKKTKTKMEVEESGFWTADYIIKLQLSRQYGTGTKTEI